jgi:hypothetical protein
MMWRCRTAIYNKLLFDNLKCTRDVGIAALFAVAVMANIKLRRWSISTALIFMIAVHVVITRTKQYNEG